MKRIKFLVLTALLPIATFVNSDCKCKDVPALCDLAIISLTVPQNITIGQAFDVVTNVTNLEEGGACSTTDVADATLNSIEIFQKDGAGSWNLIGSKDNIPQSSIFIGDLITLLESTTINVAGDFRFDYYDDNMNTIEERDESNNFEQAGRADIKSAIQKTNNFASVFITVHPLPDGTTEVEGKPIVEFN
ncbi:MAG: hypothetical protein ACKVU0_00670 [Saprospiraceae bacterium]